MPDNVNAGRTVARVLPLILGLLLVAVLGVSAVTLQARAQGDPPEELSEEELLSRITAAPQDAPAFRATVAVDQTVIPEGLIGASEGGRGSCDSGPRTARVWRGGPDQFRAELQSDNGDKVFARNGSEVATYDGATNTLKTGQRPENEAQAPEEKAASPEEIDELLAEISPTSDLQTGPPVRVAGRWAYPLTLEPKDKDSTLVERAEAFIDAEAFVPLSFELYAEGNAEPVARYEAQEFVVGPRDDERFELEAPPGAQVDELEPPEDSDRAENRDESREEPRSVSSAAEAEELVDFPVEQLDSAPGSRELTEIRVLGSEGVVQTYGSGWGTVVLAQGPERTEEPQNEETGEDAGDERGQRSAQVPSVDLGGGIEAKEISTPIGTALTWTADGVSYSLKGSVPAAELEEAARGLIARQGG